VVSAYMTCVCVCEREETKEKERDLGERLHDVRVCV